MKKLNMMVLMVCYAALIGCSSNEEEIMNESISNETIAEIVESENLEDKDNEYGSIDWEFVNAQVNSLMGGFAMECLEWDEDGRFNEFCLYYRPEHVRCYFCLGNPFSYMISVTLNDGNELVSCSIAGKDNANFEVNGELYLGMLKQFSETIANYKSLEYLGMYKIKDTNCWEFLVKGNNGSDVKLLVSADEWNKNYLALEYKGKYYSMGPLTTSFEMPTGYQAATQDEVEQFLRDNIPENELNEFLYWVED